MSEKPLHVRVAEALGWTNCDANATWGRWEYSDCGCEMGEDKVLGLGIPPGTSPETYKPFRPIPRFDTDWPATGPLIEKYWIRLGVEAKDWTATVLHHAFGTYGAPEPEGKNFRTHEYGATPLLAVCALILALKEAGKL